MPFWYTVKSDPEGDGVELYCSSNYEDALDDGSRMAAQTEPAWCHGCNAIAEVESIMDPEEIDQSLAEMADPNPAIRPKVRESLTVRFTRLKRWRARRASPPKCVACGSTRLTALPQGHLVLHPVGAGTLLSQCAGHFTPLHYRVRYMLSSEGDRLRPIELGRHTDI